MKILWTVNLIPVNVASKVGASSDVLGGWVESMAKELKKFPEIELAVACKCENGEFFEDDVECVKYYSVAYNSSTSCEEIEKRFSEIIEIFKPDLIHIEGTEFLHAKAALNISEKYNIPVVSSMQGILKGYYNYQCGQLQMDDLIFSKSLTNVFAGLLLHLRKSRWYKNRVANEKWVIGKSSYILGRTTWDRAHSYAINPKAKYYSCNRILRAPFYDEKWQLSGIERHSIYVGNGYNALKGFHFVVEALPQLIREYPDIKVYVAGHKPFTENDKRAFFKKGYGAYLKKLIEDLGVGDHIVFTGPLKAQAVAEKLSKVNDYVLCSTIENSPNSLGEAMLLGVPCVSADVGGVSSIFTGGKDGILYPGFRTKDNTFDRPYIKEGKKFALEDNANAWAEAVLCMWDDSVKKKFYCENAVSHAQNTHDREKNYRRMLEIYADIKNA